MSAPFSQDQSKPPGAYLNGFELYAEYEQRCCKWESYQSTGPPAGYQQPPPAGYQPYPPAGYQQQPPAGYAGPMHTVPGVTVVGGCPTCGRGVITESYTALGICLAICFFPIGVLCCLMLTEKHCSLCGQEF